MTTYSDLQQTRCYHRHDTPEDVLVGFTVLKIPPSSSSSSNKLLTSFFFVIDGEPCTRNMKVQHDYQGVTKHYNTLGAQQTTACLHFYVMYVCM